MNTFDVESAERNAASNLIKYSEMVTRCESPSDTITRQAYNPELCRLLHAASGCVTESGEFMDQMKRVFAYGKDLDKVNVIEELGDLMWYVQLACNVLGIPLMDVLKRNFDKLAVRYPEKFTQQNALERDLDAERRALEAKPQIDSEL